MTIICQPIDAAAGVPSYTAQQSRQAFSTLMGGGSPRALGTLSGLRPGVGGEVSATGFTIYVQPFGAVVDPAFTATQGPYQIASNAVEARTVTAASASFARIDVLALQVSDTPIDSSGARAAALVYVAGVASGSPAKPALPARSVEFATINVPKSGGGNPTVVRTIGFHVAAGGILPIAGVFPPNPYAGQHVYVTGENRDYVWNGTIWQAQGARLLYASAGGGGTVNGATPTAMVGTPVITLPAGNRIVEWSFSYIAQANGTAGCRVFMSGSGSASASAQQYIAGSGGLYRITGSRTIKEIAAGSIQSFIQVLNEGTGSLITVLQLTFSVTDLGPAD